MPKRSSRSPHVTYTRDAVRSILERTGSFWVGECEMGKLTAIAPATKEKRGNIRTGLITSGTYRTSLPDPL